MSFTRRSASLTATIASMVALTTPATAGAAVTPTVEDNKLTVTGDNAPDTVDLRVIGGKIAVNAVPTTLDAGPNAEIVVDLRGGADSIDAKLLAAGTYGALTIVGGEGNDAIAGGAGGDRLFGGPDADLLGGFEGSDVVLAGDGNDGITWNEGDGSDEVVGGPGRFDVLGVNGSDDADEFQLLAGPTTRFEGTSPEAFTIDLPGGGEIEEVSVALNDGDDTFVAAPGLPGMLTSVNGGPGNDTIAGGDGASQLLGDDGADTLRGGAGSDRVRGEAGDDFVAGGPASDVVEGQAGLDRLLGDQGTDFVFGGTDADVIVWNEGDSSEQPLGEAGNDRLEVNTSDVGNDDLELLPGPNTILERTNVDPFALTLANGTGEFESITVRTGGGDDKLTVSPGLAELHVVVNGGPGADNLSGSEESDELDGGIGEDTLSAGEGDDLMFSRDQQPDIVRGGAGEDTAETDEVTLDTISEVEHIDAPGSPPSPPTPAPGGAPPQPPAPQSPPRPAPDTVATLPRLGRLTVTRGRGLLAKAQLFCPTAETGGCRVTVRLEAAVAPRRGAPRHFVVLGSKTVALESGVQRKVSIPFAAHATTLAHHGRLAGRVRVTSSDAAGNTAADTTAVVLRIPRL